MPPKTKETSRKVVVSVHRPEISNASLNYVPCDAVEGYQERIETGVDWTIQEEAARYSKHRYGREVAEVSFSQALQQKINKSVLGGFLDKNSNISLQDQWEVILPTAVWDNEKFANEESKICWQNDNCITDDLINLIKKAVSHNDRKDLEHDFKNVNVLRVNGCEMTKLDKGLTGFRKLVRLNLCGNFLSDIDAQFIPRGLRALEMQSNFVKTLEVLATGLPSGLLYLGLAKNYIDGIEGISKLPDSITVLDLSDNDICDLKATLNAMSALPNLVSLQLAGNPCSVCAGYARFTLSKLPRLQWLDLREVLPSDRPDEPYEIHPHDLRSTYFNFTVFRIISAPQPPKGDKGAIMTFHVELELPLLDAARRNFLMFRNNESLTEMLPPPEDDLWEPSKMSSMVKSKSVLEGEASSRGSHIFHLTAVDSREIRHYTTFASNRVPWNKIMNFQEPAVRIFCPNMVGLRDTLRSVVTLRLVYTLSIPIKQGKGDKKSVHTIKAEPQEQRAVIATIRCALNRSDWTQHSQDYHWDDTLDNNAIYYGDGDLSALQYTQTAAKVVKGKADADHGSTRQHLPENLTCHFGFGIDTLRY